MLCGGLARKRQNLGDARGGMGGVGWASVRLKVKLKSGAWFRSLLPENHVSEMSARESFPDQSWLLLAHFIG